jgi:hypothetical protein
MKWKIIIGILMFLAVVLVGVYLVASQKRTTVSGKIEELTPQTKTDYTRRFVGMVQNIDKTNATMTLVAQVSGTCSGGRCQGRASSQRQACTA